MVGTRATGPFRATVQSPRWSSRRETARLETKEAVHPRRCRSRPAGLTLVEVLVAAAILAVAAIAALEFLASSDAAALAARREAMAAVEAERALAEAAEDARKGTDPSGRRVIDAATGGETLAGCTIEIRTLREARNIDTISDGPVVLPISRIIAEVTTPDGETLSVIERVAPPISPTGGSR